LEQLEWSTRRAEQTLDQALAEVRAALNLVDLRMNDKVEEMAGLMKERQLRRDDLNSRVIRLDTVLESVLNRASPAVAQLSDDAASLPPD